MSTTRVLEVGRDFDVAVLGISLGGLRDIAADFRADDRWREMLDHVGTTQSASAQLWMDSSLEELGWDAWRRPGRRRAGAAGRLGRPIRAAARSSTGRIRPRGRSNTCAARSPATTTSDRRRDTGVPAAALANVTSDHRGVAGGRGHRDLAGRQIGRPAGSIGTSSTTRPAAPVQDRLARPVPAREHRSVRALRAVPAGDDQLPPGRRRIGLREPGPGRRLDEDRLERRLHRGGGHVGHQCRRGDRGPRNEFLRHRRKAASVQILAISRFNGRPCTTGARCRDRGGIRKPRQAPSRGRCPEGRKP